MKTELFNNIPESKSPRLAWMEKHDITTKHYPKMDHPNGNWIATWGDFDGGLLSAMEYAPGGCHVCEFGRTEQDAIINLCIWHGWKLWNEE